MLGILIRRADWVTAGTLADQLGVTPRSVRSYVTAINERVAGAVESGSMGYRATPRAESVDLAEADPERGTRHDRIRALIRGLLDSPDGGVDVFEAALEMHVSSDTVESDLRRIRGMLEGTELVFARDAAVVTLEGTELARRRFLSRVVHDELDEGVSGAESLRRSAGQLGIDATSFATIGGELVDGLTSAGYAVNDLAAGDVVLHIAIASGRVARGHALPRSDDSVDDDRSRVAAVIDGIASRHLGTRLGEGDLAHLASLVMLSIVDPDAAGARAVDPDIESAVAAAVARASRTYGVELDGADLVPRLARHVQNLVQRAAEQLSARNPMTRSLKAASPLVFEMAVAVAGDLSTALGVMIPDDEITGIAMHLGTALEVDQQEIPKLTAAIVCPGPDEMRRQLRSSVTRSLGHEIDVTEVQSRYEPDWGGFETDLVLTTIDPPVRVAGGPERVVRVTPFLASRDVARVAEAANRVRRHRRLGSLRAEMERWFVPEAYLRGVGALTPEDVIRRLGSALIADGTIDQAYVDSAIERERLSSTAFTESLAVPHAMTMSASRTAIAIAVDEQAIAWGDERVHVVALVAFSESDRVAFQTVFEQFVDVFADPENARRIARRGADLPSFLTELAALIDEG